MKIKIDRRTIDDWAQDLAHAGSREIGGVLFGEQLAEGHFRIAEVTRQSADLGTSSSFCRMGAEARQDILSFHRQYGGTPERFNYLGEWHSHPHAPPLPSVRDDATMVQLVEDQAGAVNFLILVIVRISQAGNFEIGACAYLASGQRLPCEVELDSETEGRPGDD